MAYVEATAGGYEGVEIPDALYELTCKEVVDVKLKAPDQFGKTEKFRLVLEGALPDGETFTIEPLMNKTFSAFPGRTPSTLFVYADAFGCNPDPDSGFDTDEMIDKKLMGLIQTAEEKGSWPRIQTVSKVKAGAKAPARAAAPPPPRGASKKPGPILAEDGTVDWDAFYKETERLGATKESVHKAWGGEEALLSAAPVDVANWLHDWADRLTAV